MKKPLRTQFFNERCTNNVFCFAGNNERGQKIYQDPTAGPDDSGVGYPNYWHRFEMGKRNGFSDFGIQITQKQAEKLIGRQRLRLFMKQLHMKA